MARDVTLAEVGFLCGYRYLLHDRDAQFCVAFDDVLESDVVGSPGDGIHEHEGLAEQDHFQQATKPPAMAPITMNRMPEELFWMVGYLKGPSPPEPYLGHSHQPWWVTSPPPRQRQRVQARLKSNS